MKILKDLQKLLPNKYMVQALLNTPEASEDTSMVYSVGKYKVYVTNSCYATDLIVTVKGYQQPVYLEFINKTTVHLGFRTNLKQWDKKVLKERFSEQFFDDLVQAINEGQTIGAIHKRPFKHFAVWNFNTYDVIIKG